MNVSSSSAFKVEFSRLDEIDACSWDARVSSNAFGVYHQTSFCAEYLTHALQEVCWFCQVIGDSGRVVAQALLVERAPNVVRSGRLSQFVARRLSNLDRRLICQYGPLLFESGAEEEILTTFLSALRKFCASRGLGKIEITPSFYGECDRASSVPRLFQNAPFSMSSSTNRTVVRWLQNDVDVMETLKSEVRTKIRKAEKAGVVVRECVTEGDYAGFFEVLSQNARRLNLNYYYTQDRFRHFWERDRVAKRAMFWLSEHEGNSLSAQMSYFFNGVVFLGGVSVSDYGRKHGNLPGNDLIQYSAIRWGMQEGQRVIDWVGLSDDPTLQGVNDFKLKWGLEREYQMYTILSNNLAAHLKNCVFRSARWVHRHIRGN